MGNRKQPFGYRMTLGEITILPEEAELVRFIFQCYSTGATLGPRHSAGRRSPTMRDGHGIKTWSPVF